MNDSNDLGIKISRSYDSIPGDISNNNFLNDVNHKMICYAWNELLLFYIQSNIKGERVRHFMLMWLEFESSKKNVIYLIGQTNRTIKLILNPFFLYH